MKSFLSIAVLCAIATAALAHGDAMWIQNEPRFKRADGFVHCCSPHHCRVIDDPKAVKITAEGYYLTWLDKTIPTNWRAKYNSIDERYWICADGAQVHCFFAPVAGS